MKRNRKRKRRLHAALNALARDANAKLNDLNCGGCGVFAAEVAQYLQRMGYATRVVCSTSEWCSRQNIDALRERIMRSNNGRCTASDWHNNNVSMSHLAVEYEYVTKRGRTVRRFYESAQGDRPASKTMTTDGWNEYRVCEGRFTVAEARDLADYVPAWNPRFDRDQIPRLRKLVRKHLGPLLEAA